MAANGREALALFDAQATVGPAYDLLLTDIEMPELDGFGLVQALRARGERLPILALTARDQPEDRQAVPAAGCDDHVTKPCEKNQLLAACQRWPAGPPAAAATGSCTIAASSLETAP